MTLTTPVPIGWSRRTGTFRSLPFSGPRLGETEQTAYARAKTAVAEYDDLAARAAVIADPEYSKGVLFRFRGDPRDDKGALYRRNSVAFAVAQAESRSPIDYAVFGRPDLERKIAELEGWNREFRRAVTAGEESRGTKIPELGQEEAPKTGARLSWSDCAPWVIGAVLIGGVAFIALD